MVRIACPKCTTVIESAPGQRPLCPTCGFGSTAFDANKAAAHRARMARSGGKTVSAAPLRGGAASAPVNVPAPSAPPPAPAPKVTRNVTFKRTTARKTPVMTPAEPSAPVVPAAPAARRVAAEPASAAEARGATGLHGKPRRYGKSVFLVIITLGIYALVYNYKVFRELDEQHGTRHNAAWFWLGLIPALGLVFSIVYFAKELRQLRSYQAARRMTQAPTTGSFIVMLLISPITLFITAFVAYKRLNDNVRIVWKRVYQEKGVAFPR